MRLYRERLYTEEELGELEQREYGLLRRVKATIGRARRNVAKKIEEKIDKNIDELNEAARESVYRQRKKDAPKGSYRALEQIRKDVRKEQPDVYITNKKYYKYKHKIGNRNKSIVGSAPYEGRVDSGAFYIKVDRKNLSKEAEKSLGIPKYANHMIFNGRQPNAGATLHEIGHMRRALGKEGAIAKFINKKASQKELYPKDLMGMVRGNGKLLKETDSINRGGIVNNIKDIANYASKWLEERGANKYANKELKRLLKEGKISKEIYDRGREATKSSMDTYTPGTKINILSSIKNTIDIPSRRGVFDLDRFKD